jgi:hypothetical protein
MLRGGWNRHFDPEGAFWSKVDKSGGPDACWPWLAAEDSNGYGAIKWQGKKQNAHRIALELKLGRPITLGMDACHSRECTTRLCCNPTHLSEGTRRDNVADTVAQGRQHRFGGSNRAGESNRGDANGSAELTEAQVLEIDRRLRLGERHGAIIKATGATITQVKNISAGRTWGWLTGR